jgi:hypothetical protein
LGQPAQRGVTLEGEVRTWTDEISDAALTEALRAILKRIKKIDRRYDIPYVAGYSRDGETVFIDRHMPRGFTWRGRRIDTDRFLALHEIVEKTLLDQLHLHYLHAHQIALRTEQAAVRAAGIGWRDYDQFTKSNEKKIGDERLSRVPRNLDLTPYRDEDDFATLQRLADAD